MKGYNLPLSVHYFSSQMNEHLDILDEWLNNSQKVALARVIKTWGSSPRPIGSVLLINEEGKMAGSVSGGCVEGSFVKSALEVMYSGESKKLSYGVADEEAWSVGLSCGGNLDVFVEPMELNSSVWSQLVNNIKDNQSCMLISSLEEGESSTTLISGEEILGDAISDELAELARVAYDERSHKIISIDDKEYFIQVFPRKSQLLVVGAAHITVDLVAMANDFGFETIVIDPRGYFTENTVFTSPPAQILEKYPSEVLGDFDLDAYTYVAILSHDPKIDDNALEVLLPSKVGYIGVLGSRKNQAKREARLQEKGFSQDQIDRLKGPIGVNINARSAKEIALSIMAEIIEVKNEKLIR